MGRLFVVTLSGHIYSCKHCHTHFGLADDILSKSFQSHHGKAYLFDKVVNVTVGEKEGRVMTTGMHVVCDIFCVGCGSIVGWKYEAADVEDQKYKEGKFILEMFKVLDPNGNGYMIDEEALIGGSEGDD